MGLSGELLGKLSGVAIGEPQRLRLDIDREVEEGDWLFEKSIRTECGERWWTVLSARQVKPRSVLPRRFRYALVIQERQTATSEDPSIPADMPMEFDMMHYFSRYRRPTRSRSRRRI